MQKDSIFPNVPSRLPIQDHVYTYMKKNKISKAKLARRTHLSLYFCRKFLGDETCPISRSALLKICIALNVPWEKIEEWMRIAGYVFLKEYRYYEYERQIIHRFKNGRDCLEEAIFRIQLLYGEVTEE